MQEQYIEECRDNAIRKKSLELELLQHNSSTFPILSSNFENFIYFSSCPGTLESNELIMEWVRDVRLGLNPYKNLIHQISSHESFICLSALNLLRKNKNPNYIYYHGVAEIKNEKESIYYALTEDLFEDEDIFHISFRDICEKESWDTILEYYISLVLSLYNSNNDISFANYDLNLDNIMMRKMNSEVFDVEYEFENKNLWITNRGYVPTITRFSKSYIKILVEGIPKSFGYNNISQLPFETKGIYCDRGFVISDVYAILMNILECTYNNNKDAYEKLKILLKFFTKDDATKLFSNRYFIPYFEKTQNLNIKQHILFIHNEFKDVLKFSPKYDILRCIGYKLEIKSKSLEYYTIKNTIQLYDLIKYFSSQVDEDNNEYILNIINKSVDYYIKFFEKDNIKRDIERVIEIENCLKNHNIIFEIIEHSNIHRKKRYSDILIRYVNSCIVYFNTWERLKTAIKILTYLCHSSEIFKDFYDKYFEIMENNKDYYQNMYLNLISIRKFFRNNYNLFDIYSKQVLFLETLE